MSSVVHVFFLFRFLFFVSTQSFSLSPISSLLYSSLLLLAHSSIRCAAIVVFAVVSSARPPLHSKAKILYELSNTIYFRRKLFACVSVWCSIDSKLIRVFYNIIWKQSPPHRSNSISHNNVQRLCLALSHSSAVLVCTCVFASLFYVCTRFSVLLHYLYSCTQRRARTHLFSSECGKGNQNFMQFTWDQQRLRKKLNNFLSHRTLKHSLSIVFVTMAELNSKSWSFFTNRNDFCVNKISYEPTHFDAVCIASWTCAAFSNFVHMLFAETELKTWVYSCSGL